MGEGLMLTETQVEYKNKKYVCLPRDTSIGVWVTVYRKYGNWYATEHPLYCGMYQLFNENGNNAQTLLTILFPSILNYSLKDVALAAFLAEDVDREYEEATPENRWEWLEEFKKRINYFNR